MFIFLLPQAVLEQMSIEETTRTEPRSGKTKCENARMSDSIEDSNEMTCCNCECCAVG